MEIMGTMKGFHVLIYTKEIVDKPTDDVVG